MNLPVRAATDTVSVLFVMLASVAATAASGPVINTDQGLVRGDLVAGVQSWKGIPFAAPPTGELRWRAPQPPAPWSDVRDATSYGHDCQQLPFPSDAAPLGTAPAEDCLYANVWRPAGAKAKLPILVWIYGGGFVNGGASPPTYSGANIAKQGVLFISFNYRVGRFGTFAHPALTRANADGGMLANYGYLDQVAALKWVQRNAAAFGGDPARVTLMGESAGGFSVHAMITSPLAAGLYSQAVILSGGDGKTLGNLDLAKAETVGADWGQSKGVAPDDEQALAKLRALSADAVTDGLNLASMFAPADKPRTFISPFADGKIALNPLAVYESGQFAHIPVMIGATSGDIGGKTGFMIGGARSVAAVLAGKGAPVYEYRFSYVADSAHDPKQEGAGHASDIPFFLHTEAIKYGKATTPRDIRAGRIISTYLVNFVKSGDPNGTALPKWARYSQATDQMMDFAGSGLAVAQKDPWGAAIDSEAPSAAGRP